MLISSLFTNLAEKFTRIQDYNLYVNVTKSSPFSFVSTFGGLTKWLLASMENL